MKILIIGYVWPEPQSSAAGLRTLSLVQTFLAQGWEVVFASAARPLAGAGDGSFEPFKQSEAIVQGFNLNCQVSFENRLDLEFDLSRLQCVHLKLNDPSFDAWIQELQPDGVLFDRYITEEQFGARVAEQCPLALRMIDTQDLHFLRLGRQQLLLEGFSLSEIQSLESERALDLVLHQPAVYRELGAILRSDCSFLLSDAEMVFLKNHCGISKEQIALGRFHYERPPIDKHPSFETRKNMVMIGNFRHGPNWDGVQWFRSEVWPLVRAQLPEVEVHIYGAYPSKEASQLTRKSEGFIIQGPAESSSETLRRYRVNLAPLRYGAGIKGKVTDGWWSGTPVVSTSIGAEGMFGGSFEAQIERQHSHLGFTSEDFEHFGGCVADTAGAFAEAMIKLYSDSGSWAEKQGRGFKIIEKHYLREKNEPILAEKVAQLVRDLPTLRKKNLLGRILSHHQYQSTKYFSKWIEEKEQHALSSSKKVKI